MKRLPVIFLSVFVLVVLTAGLVFQAATPQQSAYAQDASTPTPMLEQLTPQVTESATAESAALDAWVPVLADGITMNGPAASTDPNAWHSRVVVSSVATGDILIDQQIYGRTDFAGAALCEPINVVSDKPLTGDLDNNGIVTDQATGTVTTLAFGDDVALGLTSQWDINHASNVCAFSLWEEQPIATAMVIASNTETTTPEPFQAHVQIFDVASGNLVYDGNITHRTEFHDTDLDWNACGPLKILTDKPLKGDADHHGTFNGTDYVFAQSLHLLPGQDNLLTVVHPTNCSFALQEEVSVISNP